ncbi:MAG: phage head morphogenesis protein [Tannerella sp.]|nr:phage head morphogenesis protein [Tannerella sp.]
MYQDTCPHCKGVRLHAESLPDDYLNDIQREFERLLKQLYGSGEPDNKLLATQGKVLADRVAESYKEIAIDYSTPDAEMLMRLTRDTWQFSAAKNYKELRDLTLALKDENGNLREWSDFKEAAGKIGVKYNEIWMRTEYDQAIAGAQNAARWTEFEREKDVIPNLQYQTVGDNVVRPEHQLLNGIIKPIGDPFWATHYPPNGWGCRCEAVQSLEGDGDVTPDTQVPNVPIAPMFRTNLAKTGLIYPKNHPYYNGIPRAELRKAIAYLPPENTYQSVVIGDHEVDVHPFHGEKELGKNLETCNTLLKHDPKARLKLLPVINENEMGIKEKFYPKDYVKKFGKKNADCLYGKKVVEFEEPSGEGWSIQKAIKNGKKQADFVIMRVPDNMDWNKIEKVTKSQLGYYKGQDINIWVMNNNELRKYRP